MSFNKKKTCPFMWAFTQGGQVVPIHCGLWSCPNCSVTNARFWAKRVWYGMEVLDGIPRFWTLTMSGKIRTAGFGFQILPDMWESFRKAMQRSNKGWTYAAFSEGQPKRRGMPHFHIVTYQPIPPSYTRLKDFAHHHGFGHQAEDKSISSDQGAWYVSKYASKGDPTMPKGFRRVRLSQDWPELPDEPDHLPYIVQHPKEQLSDYLLRVQSVSMTGMDTLVKRWLERGVRV